MPPKGGYRGGRLLVRPLSGTSHSPPPVHTFGGMSATLQVALAFAFAAVFMALLWRSQLLPVTVAIAEPDRQERPKQPEDGGDEQLPETDRAPRGMSHLLTYAVAVTAAVRLGVLVTFHR